MIFNFYESYFELLDFRLSGMYLLYNSWISLFLFIMYSKENRAENKNWSQNWELYEPRVV